MSDDLERGVQRLETRMNDDTGLPAQVRVAREDAAAARHLAAASDRDVSEIRREVRDFRYVTTQSFNAMREDLVDLRHEMNTQFELVDARFKQVDSRFEQVDSRFEQVDSRFAQVDAQLREIRSTVGAAAAGQQQIVDMLTTLIERDQP